MMCATAVREIAKAFREQGYSTTERLFLDLADILERADDKRRESVFNKLAPTFRREYGKNDKDLLMLHDFVDAVFRESILSTKHGFSDIMIELQPLFREMQNAVGLIGSLTRTFVTARTPSHKQDFLGLCVIYLWHVEGVLDEAYRLLWVLYNASLGRRIDVSDVWNLPMKGKDGLQERFDELSRGMSRILFLGLEDYHLRNAIAHSRLEYDEQSMRMRFRDMKLDKGRQIETYNKSLSGQEFSRFYELVEGVSTLFIDILMIIVAYQMAFSENPF